MNSFSLVLLCTTITFAATAIGASFIYLFKNINFKFEKICLGLASGIMISASIFSLILPSLDYNNNWFSILGIILGGILIFFLKILNIKIRKDNKYLFYLAVTLHNIPEGMAIGLSCAMDSPLSALVLALGIAIQNIPEGIATALPLLKFHSKHKSFLLAVLSGLVEPVGALIMFLLSNYLKLYMPLFLCLAASTMIFVVVDELIPESKDSRSNTGLISFIFGFIIMMMLDILLS